jgi:hypothetical protein
VKAQTKGFILGVAVGVFVTNLYMRNNTAPPRA